LTAAAETGLGDQPGLQAAALAQPGPEGVFAARSLGKYGKNMEKHMENTWKTHGNKFKKTWKRHGKDMERHGKTWKDMERHGKSLRR